MPTDKEPSIYSEHVKAVLKFIWRHILFMAVLYIAADVLIHTKSLNVEHFVTLATWAVILDWVKMKFKFERNPDYQAKPSFDDRPLATQQWWNSAMLGTPVYHIDQLGRK